MATEPATRDGVELRFLDAMESAYGYRPRVRDGALINGRDADRYEGFRLASRPQPAAGYGALLSAAKELIRLKDLKEK